MEECGILGLEQKTEKRSLQQKIYKMNQEHLLVPDSKEALKKKRGHMKVKQKPTKRAPNVQIWKNFNNNSKKSSTEL